MGILHKENKTIYIVGPSSTGKTTLCRALAKRLNLRGPAVVTEVARQVMITRGYTRENVGSLEMQQAIMEEHLKREKEGKCCSIQLCDRSAVDPIVYAVLTAPDEREAQRRKSILVNSPNFQAILPKYRDSVFILLKPVGGWLVDDGVRLLESQAEAFAVFKSILGELGIKFLEMGEGMRFLEERMVIVMGSTRL